jgi:hypothetical protein
MFAATVAALTIGACGGGKRQDANEATGRFRVEVVRASFPRRQRLAERSSLVITVKNTGSTTVPDIAVTVSGFDVREKDAQLADPDRPIFAVNGVRTRVGDFPDSKEAAPDGCETAYVDTWACGSLRPGHAKTFKWSVTAIKAGSYRIRYAVAAALDGKAAAVDATGARPRGLFVGMVSNAAANVRVADDGRTVVKGRSGP